MYINMDFIKVFFIISMPEEILLIVVAILLIGRKDLIKKENVLSILNILTPSVL